MKKVDRFLLKSFIGPLIFTFFIVLIILLLQFLWMYVDELAGKGLVVFLCAGDPMVSTTHADLRIRAAERYSIVTARRAATTRSRIWFSKNFGC